MKQTLVAAAFLSALLASCLASAQRFSSNPEKSFFIGFDLGVAFDPDDATRSPLDLWDRNVEAYSLGAFLFGISGGFRFNEVFGIEGGWHDQQHDAHPEWGGQAYFQVAHIAGRFAWPLPTRQTPVFRIGPAIGQFAYGEASPGSIEDNRTLVFGGMTGIVLEHEFVLGIVGLFEVTYLPLYRFGMGDPLYLQEYYYTDGGDIYVLDLKDFSKGQLVHLVWISIGVQFEWTFH